MPRSAEPPRRSALSILAPTLTGVALIGLTVAVVPSLTAQAPRVTLEPMTFSLAVAPSLRGCARDGCHARSPNAPALDGVLRSDEASRVAAFSSAVRFVSPGAPARSALYRRALGEGSCRPAALPEAGCDARALRDWIEGRPVRRCAAPM